MLDLFADRILRHFEEIGRSRAFAKGETVFRRGDPGGVLYIVERGRVEISLTTATGGKSILALAGPGDILGDIACLDGGPRSADVRALEACDMLEVSRGDVLRALAADEKGTAQIIEALCQKVRNATDMFELVSTGSSKSRLAACLLRLSDAGDGAALDEIAVSQSWLGDYANLTRENVNRQLKAFSEQGLIETRSGRLLLKDRDGLERIVWNAE